MVMVRVRVRASVMVMVMLMLMLMVMVMVMVICLGLYRSLPRYLYSSSGPVRRERRRASNLGKEEPSLARPLFVVLYAITV